MKECLRRDKARTNVLPISELGLLEMTRQRAEESIRAATYIDCPYCQGRGKVKSSLSMSVEIQRHLAEVLRKQARNGETRELRVTVNPAILERLRREDEAELVAMEERFHIRLTFVSDASRHLEAFGIADAATGQELYSTAEHPPEKRVAPGRALPQQ